MNSGRFQWDLHLFALRFFSTRFFPNPLRVQNEVRIKANLRGMQMNYIYIHRHHEHMCERDGVNP